MKNVSHQEIYNTMESSHFDPTLASKSPLEQVRTSVCTTYIFCKLYVCLYVCFVSMLFCFC